MASQLPEPLAQGDLGRTPFAHVLLYVHKHGLAGTLVVWLPQAGEERPKQDRIRFERGAPVAARFVEPASRIERGMLPLFARTSGPYAFYESIDLVGGGDGVRSGRVDVMPLVAASLRGSSRDDVVSQVCAGFGDAKLRLELGADLDSLGLLPDERTFVELLRAEPMTVSRLAEISPLPPKMAERIVYLLALAKLVAPWEEPPASARPMRPARTPSSGLPRRDSGVSRVAPRVTSSPPEPAPAMISSPPPSSDAPPAPPGELSSEHRALWTEITDRFAAVEHENYFEMLGVSKDVPTSAIQKAYFNQVKKWHPDRVPAPLAELRPHVETIFRHLTRAQETLSDDKKRGMYLATVQDGGGTPASERQLGLIVHAAMEFRKVEVLMRRRDYDQALALIDEILTLADEEPDYHAARGWVLYQKFPNDPSMRAAALVSLDRAISLTDKHDKAHYYRGMILHRAGRHAEAADAFRRAVQINPKNVEAQRMVRLAEMRGAELSEVLDEVEPKKSSAPPKKSESLLGKIFGNSNKKKG